MDLTRININKKITAFANVILIIVAFIAAGIGVVYYGADLTELLKFLLYFLFYVQLPGVVVLSWLKVRSAHICTNIAVGFFLGWALVIAEYYVTALIHTDILLYGLGPLLSLWYIINFIRKRKSTGEYRVPGLGSISVLFMLFAVLGFIFAMLFSQYEYMAPDACAYSKFPYPDNPFHMGIIQGLAEGYPPGLPWLDGKINQYHFFSELFMAIPVRLFGMRADFLVMSCTPYLVTFAFSTAVYSFYREFTSRKGNAGLYCLLTLLGNYYMKSSIRSGLWLHVYGNVNNAGYGIAASMVTLIVLKKIRAEGATGKEKFLAIIALIAMIMLTTGIKGPMGAILIAAIWSTFVLGLILRKVKLVDFIALLLVSVGFAIIYVFVIGMSGQEGAGGGSLFVMGTITDGAFYRSALISMLKGFGVPVALRKCILAGVFMVFCLTAFFVPYVIGYIRELILVISGRKDFVFARVSIYAASLIGLLAMFMLNFNGHSQAYFGFLGMSLSPIIGIWFLEDLGGKGVIAKLINLIFVIMFAITAACFCFSVVKQINYVEKLDYDTLEGRNRYLTTSQYEYKAMQWLYENTPEDALMATNRYESKSPDIYSPTDRFAHTYFSYCVYAQRNFWFEGAGYSTSDEQRVELIETNDKLYDAEDPDRDKLVKELGIDYVVASKRFKDVEDLEDDTYKCCYESLDVIIYEIQ